jgi:hypothetical protein
MNEPEKKSSVHITNPAGHNLLQGLSEQVWGIPLDQLSYADASQLVEDMGAVGVRGGFTDHVVRDEEGRIVIDSEKDGPGAAEGHARQQGARERYNPDAYDELVIMVEQDVSTWGEIFRALRNHGRPAVLHTYRYPNEPPQYT